ncbi:MAG: methyltransferase domain-containing protein [Alphaproteobacteria bacterium]|nr:methyltransferase domain-containing protein [Alphaproteobacteria bacterium]MCW5741090.1 methyltransferase domain-containing protein [Alphaproteobacteria bacterium]
MGAPEQLRIVGTAATREIAALLDAVAAATGKRKAHVLQVGARTHPAERGAHNWRHLVEDRLGKRARFTGVDSCAGANVDVVCGDLTALEAAAFDLVICDRVLEHAVAPWHLAGQLRQLMAPGGHLFVRVAWARAHHAEPDDYWRMSFAGVMLLFDALRPLSLFYTGGAAGLDIAYRVMRGDAVELSPAIGAVEQALFQVVLDHEDNRAMLANQAGQRYPLSRDYLPTMFVNVVARREP